MPLFDGLLKKYLNPVFIETGTFLGDGICHAVWAGFNRIYSIEKSEYYYERAVDEFKYFPNVKIIYGDSSVELKKLIEDIDCPITFWLDAHYSEQGTAKGDNPLLKELEAIRSHPIKTHDVLIDDIREYGPLLDGMYFSKIEIVKDILICRL